MSQVSEIIVHWTPETSGRVASIQIQSRIAGTPEWTEQSANFDPAVGEFRFTANAPATEVEVRTRYRMVEGVFGAWTSGNIITAPAVVEYDTITGLPTKLADLNPAEGEKLDGIEPGATVGAPAGTPFGNGTVDDYISDNHTVTTAHLAALANAEVQRIRDRALVFPGPDGASIYTLNRREETSRVTADTAFAETFELLGAVTPDGSAFVIGDKAVTVTGTDAGATVYQSVGSRFEASEGNIETIQQVFTDANGTVARALLRVDADGRIIGYAATNDGRTGAFIVTADVFKITDPDTGKDYFYADDLGKVKMRDVEVDTIKVGAVGFDQMTMGAVQKAAFYSLTNDVAVPQNATAEICSITFFKEDTDSILEIQMFANCKSADDLQFRGTILVDNMVMQTTNVNIVLDSRDSQGEMPITPFAYVGGISRGTRTVSFKLYNRETDNIPLIVQAGSTLKVTELRKASIGTSTGSGGPIAGGGTGGSGGGTGGGGYQGGNHVNFE